MFDPMVGRWLEEDPIGFEAGDDNLYRYVGNDATNATDPSGLREIPTYLYPQPSMSFSEKVQIASSYWEAKVEISGPASKRDKIQVVQRDVFLAAEDVYDAWKILADYWPEAQEYYSNNKDAFATAARKNIALLMDDNTGKARAFYQSKFREIIDYLHNPKTVLPISLLLTPAWKNPDGPAQTDTTGIWPCLMIRTGISLNPRYFTDPEAIRRTTMFHEFGRYIPNEGIYGGTTNRIETSITDWDFVIITLARDYNRIKELKK